MVLSCTCTTLVSCLPILTDARSVLGWYKYEVRVHVSHSHILFCNFHQFEIGFRVEKVILNCTCATLVYCLGTKQFWVPFIYYLFLCYLLIFVDGVSTLIDCSCTTNCSCDWLYYRLQMCLLIFTDEISPLLWSKSIDLLNTKCSSTECHPSYNIFWN